MALLHAHTVAPHGETKLSKECDTIFSKKVACHSKTLMIKAWRSIYVDERAIQTYQVEETSLSLKAEAQDG